jgi:DNA-binding LacI/PurR family transcriptional regulator
LLNDNLTTPFGREALAGYLEAFEHHGLSVLPSLMRTSNFTIEGGRAAAAAILKGAERPTAIFAVDDESAVGAMQAIQEMGLRVPQDISVVGMSDIPLAAAVLPSLTTVRIRKELLGRRAAMMLVNILAGGRPDPPREVLPTELIIRDSTMAPAAD